MRGTGSAHPRLETLHEMLLLEIRVREETTTHGDSTSHICGEIEKPRIRVISSRHLGIMGRGIGPLPQPTGCGEAGSGWEGASRLAWRELWGDSSSLSRRECFPCIPR